MSVNATSPRSIPWLETFWQDLQPTPGRLNNTMRMVLSSTILLVLVLVLQMPFANYCLYIIFVIGRESPSVSLRTGVLSALILASAIAIELGVVILSDNWSAGLEMCQWRRETLDQESIWDEGRSTSLSR